MKSEIETALPVDRYSAEIVVGCAIQNPVMVLPRVLSLKGRFGVEKLNVIFDAVVTVSERGGPSSLVEVTRELHESGKLEAVGGAGVVTELQTETPDFDLKTIEFYAKRVEKVALAREMYAIADDLRKGILDGNEPGEASKKARESLEKLGAPLNLRSFPLIEKAASFVANAPPKPPILIEGVLSAGAKMIITGGSKSFKSWSLVNLALSVSSGNDFWGWQCKPGNVLFVNFEIRKSYYSSRLKAVSKAMGLAQMPASLDVWNLRGFSASAESILPRMRQRMEANGEKYQLVILDPIYKLLGDRDENSAKDIGDLFRELELFSEETGAAIVLAHHHAKGLASGKFALDRGSGSGVFARDPDALIDLTPHEEDGAFTVTTTLRDFAPVEPLVIQWDFPLFSNTELDPGKLKSPGGKKKRTVDEIVELLSSTVETSNQDWIQKANKIGISRSRYYELRKEAVDKELIKATSKNGYLKSESGQSPHPSVVQSTPKGVWTKRTADSPDCPVDSPEQNGLNGQSNIEGGAV